MNLNKAIDDIVGQLKTFMGDKKAIIGLSGGIDSTVIAYLCVKALGKENVIGVSMPCASSTNQNFNISSGESVRDARKVADELGIEVIGKNIAPTIISLTSHRGGRFSDLTLGNAMARLRMVTLYLYANEFNGMVIGTTNKTEAEIGYYCYDEKTRALTTKGLKFWNELGKGDMVFSLNLEIKKLEERKINDVYRFDFNGELIRGKNRGIDFKVTPNHKMVLQNAHNPDVIFLAKLDDYLKDHIHLNIPIPKGWDGESKCNILNGFDVDDLMYLYGLFIGDGSANHGKTKYKLKALKHIKDKKTGRFQKIENPLNKPTEYNAYTICFAIPENNKNNAWYKLTGILDKYNIKWHKGTFGIKIVLSDNKLFNIFLKCGQGALNKKIPRFLLSFPKENLQFLFQGLIDSDGDKREYFYTSSSKLASQVVELCFKLGKTASIASFKPREAEYLGKKIKSKKSYCVKVCRKIKSRAISQKDIKAEKYQGVVWCPEIDHHGNLLVERNGSFYFCGNTKYGDGAVDVEPIADLYKTEVWEVAKILGVPENIINKPPSAELWENHTDEDEFGMTYQEMDEILQEPSMSDEELDAKYGAKGRKVMDMVENSNHKKCMPPAFKIRNGKND